jgi:hypothetical protein
MDCPHCGTAFHDQWRTDAISSYLDKGKRKNDWYSMSALCPSCLNVTVDLAKVTYKLDGTQRRERRLRVHPPNTFRKPTPPEVPQPIREDYEEACKVLPISPKASAALSRRCVQAVLSEQGYRQKDLAVQIGDLLSEEDTGKAIPSSLRQTVDAIRNFGNFSAHPITDQTTLQIIDVEDGEAEWCLDILEEMFDHYYVRPAQVKARKAALDAKLAAAGKPLSK